MSVQFCCGFGIIEGALSQYAGPSAPGLEPMVPLFSDNSAELMQTIEASGTRMDQKVANFKAEV